jgi:hypothetical protein
MSLREIAKAHLSEDQRKGSRRIYTAFAKTITSSTRPIAIFMGAT